ncbi:MAG: DUF2950 domain-containing protein [Terracidiphilus sp.]|jgi:hypothetical protein
MLRDAKQIGRSSLVTLAAVLLGAFLGVSGRAPAQSTSPQNSPAARASTSQAASLSRSRAQHKTFPSAEEAADALYTAAKRHDESFMLAILGPDARDIVVWTDNSADRTDQDDQFTKKYEQMHRLVKEPDDETTLYVGGENWPLPIPIVERNGSWYFDCSLGRREVLYRRIGENEMNTIDALRGAFDAENQYYTNAAEVGTSAVEEYAQHLTCSQGQHDGLFFPASGGDNDSNAIGPYLAQASYDLSDREPFHGYFFRILTAQGPRAHGGARNYIVNGKMTGGFAIVAFPAVHRSSGVKTFIVSRDGRVFEKDLGPRTTQLATAMKSYDPDDSWALVRRNEFLDDQVIP